MIPGIDPKVDYAFKVLFGREESRPLLIDLLNAVLRRGDGERIVSVELLNPFNPKAAIDDNLSIVDVRVRDETGRLFNVEMQTTREPAFASRIVYYAARSHSLFSRSQAVRRSGVVVALRAFGVDPARGAFGRFGVSLFRVAEVRQDGGRGVRRPRKMALLSQIRGEDGYGGGPGAIADAGDSPGTRPQSSVDDLGRCSLQELDRLAAELEREYRDAQR